MDRLSFDIDGVIADWHLIAYEYCRYSFKIKEEYDFFWNNADNLLTVEEVNRLINNLDLYYSSRVSEEDRDVLRKLSKFYEICYITGRPRIARDITYNWLWKYNLPYPYNLTVGIKKEGVVKDLNVKYHIEDRLNEANKLKDLTTVIIKDQPWNRSDNTFLRIYSLVELLDIL